MQNNPKKNCQFSQYTFFMMICIIRWNKSATTNKKNNNNHNPVVYNGEGTLASSRARELIMGSIWG